MHAINYFDIENCINKNIIFNKHIYANIEICIIKLYLNAVRLFISLINFV